MYQYCPNCFCETNSVVCPKCGYDQKALPVFGDTVIPPFTILKGRYLIGRVLGRGGFGITYIARDMSVGRNVAIKEYMPENYAQRNNTLRVSPSTDDHKNAFEHCKKNFKAEGHILYALRENSFVVDIYDGFSENNTEYLVLEYVDGVTVKTLTNRNQQKLSVDESLLTVLTIGSALMEIHKKGYIHRDISPENIMMTTDGRIKLIDFGAAMLYENKRVTVNESIFLKPGFTPPEQYDYNARQGPWTDVYALGATLYTALAGKAPIASDKRKQKDELIALKYINKAIPPAISDAVENAMRLDYASRYQSVGDFLDDLAKSVPKIQNDGITQLAPQTVALIRKKTQDVEQKNFHPYVIVNTPQGSSEFASIPSGQFIVVGRDASSVDICIHGDNTGVGRNHCYIGYDKNTKEFVLMDNSSVNGTFFGNAMRLAPNVQYRVKPGTSIYLANKSISLLLKLM